jgi:hypothetical protein
MRKRVATYLIAGLSMIAATDVAAKCSDPKAVGANDTIIQFSNKDASGSRGALGTKGTLEPTLPGTLYFDYKTRSLQLCDGKEWVRLESLPVQEEEIFPLYEVWGRQLSSGSSTTFSTPVETTGEYTLKTTLVASSSDHKTCEVYLRKGGSRTLLSGISSHDGRSRRLEFTHKLYGKGDGSYAYELMSTEASDETRYVYSRGGGNDVHGPEGLGRSSSGVGGRTSPELGEFSWDGRLSLDVESGATCNVDVSILRTG